MIGSIWFGPTEQFAPTTSTSEREKDATTSLTALPPGVVPSSPKASEAMIGRSDALRTALTATAISRISEIVSMQIASTPPSSSASICSV